MKKILAIVLTFVLCFGVLSLAFATDGNESSATVPDGYTGIYTAEDLNDIRNNLSGKYILMNDIDLSSYGNWNPIGTSETPFTGELDGNGFSIFGMTIKGEYTDEDRLYFALFASAKNSSFLNLSVINADIDVKYIGSTIQLYRAGVIAGYGNGIIIKDCIVSGEIKVDGFYKGSVGGFIGKANMLSASNCANHAYITIINLNNPVNVSIGGISGTSTNGTTLQCCNYGKITVTGTDISAEHRKIYAGGIQGNSDGSADRISNCFNRGNINLNFSAPSAYAGGITGEAYIVENSYNSGIITVPENYEGFAGGVSGDHWTDGLAITPSPYIENTYYINENLYPSYVNSYAPDDSDFNNVKLLTEEEFKNQNSFVGFDFDAVWSMEENGYPVLRNEPVIPEDKEPASSSTEPTVTSTTSPAEPTTLITEASTNDFTETTMVTVPSSVGTTNPVTEPSITAKPTTVTPTEATTEPSSELSTEPETQPNGTGEEPCWLAKLIMKIIGFFKWIFTAFAC